MHGIDVTKERRLEWACMKNYDFTVLVNGGGRRHWVSMCTVWPLYSKWLSEYSNKSAPNFVLSLNIPPWKLFGWFRELQLWATGDWQLYHNDPPAHASRLVQFSDETNHPGDSASLQTRFGALQLMAFPKTEITFEREEISDHPWNSEKYDRQLVYYNWENRVRSRGAYFERNWGIIVLCAMFLVSWIFINKCL